MVTTQPRPNDVCPFCKSGRKYKKCCRNKDRAPETCHFCKKTEAEGIKGEYAVLKETGDPIFACTDCIEERTPKEKGGDASFLTMMTLATLGYGASGRRFFKP